MSTRWWTLVVWALVAASALFWGLRLFVSGPALPARTPVASNGPAVRADLTRLLGNDPPPVVTAVAEPPPDARFQLIGVLAPRATAAAKEGLALIAVDGKPAKAYRVGALIDGQLVLKAVAARGAQLGPRDGATQVTLNLAPPMAAATGALPTLSVPATPSYLPPSGPAGAAPGGIRQPPTSSAPEQPSRRMLPRPGMPADNPLPPGNGPDGLPLR